MSRNKKGEVLMAKLCCEARESDIAPREVFVMNEGRWPENAWKVYSVDIPLSLMSEVREFYDTRNSFRDGKDKPGPDVFVVWQDAIVDIILDAHFTWRTELTEDPTERIKAHVAKLRREREERKCREEAEREAEEKRKEEARAEKERKEIRKKEWISKFGSEALKLKVFELGCDCTRLYLTERVEKELAGPVHVLSYQEVCWHSRSCPSDEGAWEAKKLLDMGHHAQVVWITKCKLLDKYEQEAIVIHPLFGYENFVAVIFTEDL